MSLLLVIKFDGGGQGESVGGGMFRTVARSPRCAQRRRAGETWWHLPSARSFPAYPVKGGRQFCGCVFLGRRGVRDEV